MSAEIGSSQWWEDVDHLIELRGVYDGWSVAVMRDGTRVNRWANADGNGPDVRYTRRYEITEAFLRGEEPKGRWF